MLKELTTETMPIILDESFAYYDEERLENILKYLDTEFTDSQIIIFTCTNREKEILKSDLLFGLTDEEIENKISNTDLQIYDFLKGMN